MDWAGKVYSYCERGTDPSFWAEPFNATSNGAFLLAALCAAVSLARSPQPGSARTEWALIALTAVIGGGSFPFHTYATRWAAVADVGPIGVFMIASLVYAQRRYLDLSWPVVMLWVLVFAAALWSAGHLTCTPGLLPVTAAAGRPCLNGSLSYVPALIALLMTAGILLVRHHVAGPLVLAAAATFAVSLTMRTLDVEICALSEVFGRLRGTHAVWHVLNAATLFLLLIAAIRHGRRGQPGTS